eukprot:TRINITY_DN6239_c0_g1_i1.p1 TRINITY_DN6239_c0_g1~~TRINITY_DN6239_c0_g1_i1.p1  ORF type:complete len:193 (+),score=70.07 TRINITY_DN6239_c0_g1_i1:167-745(+)
MSKAESSPTVGLDDLDDSDHYKIKSGDELKEAKVQKLFGLAPTEKLKEGFKCAMKLAVPHPGTLYITDSHLLFHSKFPSKETAKVEMVEIVTIEKKKIGMVNSAGIRMTVGNQELQFTSFTNNTRDAAYDLIEQEAARLKQELAERNKKDKAKSDLMTSEKKLTAFDKIAASDFMDEEQLHHKEKCCSCTIV